MEDRASQSGFRETSYSLDLLIGALDLAGYEQQLPDISYRQEKRALPKARILSNSKTLIQLLSEKIKFFVVGPRSVWYDDISGDNLSHIPTDLEQSVLNYTELV